MMMTGKGDDDDDNDGVDEDNHDDNNDKIILKFMIIKIFLMIDCKVRINT